MGPSGTPPWALEAVEQRREQDAPASAGASHEQGAMERGMKRGCELDVHKKTVTAHLSKFRFSSKRGRQTRRGSY